MSLVDFVPDTPPYEFLTVVELEPAIGANELDNLATLIQSRR